MEIIKGKITDVSDSGVTIVAPLPSLNRLIHRQYETVEIALPDGRHISPEQRRKIYALLNEIADYAGDNTEDIKQIMKMSFVMERMQALRKQLFSLADVDMTTASEFISYLIEFIIANDIPTMVPLTTLCDDIGKYVYACMMHHKCCVCGKRAELHHVDAVGMGRDRTEIDHIGMRALPLCREHHQEAHKSGVDTFMERYHLQPVAIDEPIRKAYKLKKGKQNG